MLANINWSGVGQSLVDTWLPVILIITAIVAIALIRKIIKCKSKEDA